jgi:hypothetical protein
MEQQLLHLQACWLQMTALQQQQLLLLLLPHAFVPWLLLLHELTFLHCCYCWACHCLTAGWLCHCSLMKHCLQQGLCR